MPYKDPQRQKEAQRRHYQNNKSAYTRAASANRLERRKALAQIVREAKNKSCADCTKEFHYCQMDFDHVRGKKRAAVGSMVNDAVPLEVLLTEISKCDVVCSNCHRLRTFERDNGRYAIG